MNATQKGIIANVVGIAIIWAAAKGVIIPDAVRDQLILLAGDSISTLLAFLATAGLALNQWLIRKAKREQPPTSADKMPPNWPDNSGRIRGDLLIPLWCIAAVVALAAMALPGCANMTQQQQDQQLILAAQVATMTYIEAETDPDKRHQRAANIVLVADAGTQWIDGQDVTLDNLTLLAMDRINGLELEPSKRALAMGLVNYIDLQLQTRIKQGLLSPEDKATVSALLRTVSNAAAAY